MGRDEVDREGEYHHGGHGTAFGRNQRDYQKNPFLPVCNQSGEKIGG